MRSANQRLTGTPGSRPV